MAHPALGAPAPTVFNFHDHSVRTVIRDGEVWFVASDVCSALGYVNPSKAVADHLDDDERSHEQLDRSRMGSKAVIISESGLYALVLRSRKPEARKFAKWVTAEVLPAIRKTGQYVAKPYTTGPRDTLTAEQADTLRNMLTDAAKARHPGDGKKQGALLMRGWSKLKAHFKTDYRHIPQAEFAEALSIVARHIAESGELLDVAPTQAQIEAAALAAITKPGARYFVTFHENRHKEQVITLQSIPEDAMVLPVSQMAEILSSPDVCLPTKFYTTLSRACMDVVERRAS